MKGSCTRGVCTAGWYDIDGDPGSGCEASCVGATCTTGSGTSAWSVTFGAPPVPEIGVVASAFSNSGPIDPNAAGISHGLLGEATPLPWHDPALAGDAFVSSSSARIQNLAGYDATLH